MWAPFPKNCRPAGDKKSEGLPLNFGKCAMIICQNALDIIVLPEYNDFLHNSAGLCFFARAVNEK